MRQVLSKSVLVTAAVSGVLSMTAGHAHADATAENTAADSPGVVSGNSAQVPVNVPVNLCGNTVNVIGLLNPAFGNKCANHSYPGKGPARASGSTAASRVTHSPGVVSGNNVQAPVHVPVNACGNTVDVVALLNPAFGNKCSNGSGEHTPPAHQPPADEPPADQPPANEPPADQPPTDEPPADQPPTDEPPADQPPTDEPPADQPPTDEPPADQPPADEPPADQPPTDEPPVDQPPADEPPADEPPADEPPAEEPPAAQPPVSAKPSVPGNSSVPGKPSVPGEPSGGRPTVGKPHLAHTGAGELGGAAALSAALLGGGVLLTRRGRAAQR